MLTNSPRSSTSSPSSPSSTSSPSSPSSSPGRGDHRQTNFLLQTLSILLPSDLIKSIIRMELPCAHHKRARFLSFFHSFSISLSKLLNHFMLRSHSHLRPLQSLFEHSNSPSVLDSYTFYLLYYGLRVS